MSKTIHNLDQLKKIEDALEAFDYVRVIELLTDKNEGLTLVRCTYFISSFGRFLVYHRGLFRFIGSIKDQYEYVTLSLLDREDKIVRRTYPLGALVQNEFSGGPVPVGGALYTTLTTEDATTTIPTLSTRLRNRIAAIIFVSVNLICPKR